MGVYVPDNKGIDRIATGQQVRKHMRRVGEIWAEVLRASAPRDSGDYANSISVSTLTVLVADRPRIAAQITVSTRYAATLEAGGKYMPNPPRPLTKLLDLIQAADPNKHKLKGKRG